jgi:hypothetical protein
VRNGRFQTATDKPRRAVTITALVLAAAMTLVWILRFFGMFGGPVPV